MESIQKKKKKKQKKTIIGQTDFGRKTVETGCFFDKQATAQQKTTTINE